MDKPKIKDVHSKFYSSKIGFWLLAVFLLTLMHGEAFGYGKQQPSVLATVFKWFPLIGKGFLLNLLVSFVSMSIGTFWGVFLGLLQMSQNILLKKLSYVITQFFRNAPWLVLVFYTIYLIPFELVIAGYIIPFPSWIKATIGLSLPVMANMSEIVRGGIQSVPLAQWESAESLAFSRIKTIWLIILPQCIKRMIPPWMNLYAILITASPLISLVGINDALTYTRAALEAEGGRIDLLLPLYLMLLIMFFIYCFPIAWWTVKLEQRFSVQL